MKTLLSIAILLLPSLFCTAQIPNSGFEQINTDNTIAYWAPACLINFVIGDSIVIDDNKFVSISTNARSGNYALQLSNGKNVTNNYSYTGCAISTNMAQAVFGYVNSFTLTSTPQDFHFHYLLQNNLYNDTSICIVRLFNNMGTEIATGQEYIYQNNASYALKTVPIIYSTTIDTALQGNLIPTTANIQFNNSTGTSTAHFGTRLLIDDLSFNSPTAIDNFSVPNDLIYPNPTNSVLHINNQVNVVKVQLVNALGQVVLTNTKNTIDIAHLPAGLYTVIATTTNKVLSQQISKQ